MKALALLLVIGLVVVAASDLLGKEHNHGSEEFYRHNFATFMNQYNKKYNKEDLVYRFKVFKANMDFIDQHNKKNLSYTLGMNKFGDMPFHEFHAKYTGLNYVKRDFIRSRNAPAHKHEGPTPPKSIDWRVKTADHVAAVTPVKDQEQCGSCWAFSATGSIEGAWAIATKGTIVSLSEQELVDCSGSYGNQGCNGGLMDYAFEYVKASGLATEKDYPYKAVDQKCKKVAKSPVKVTGYVDVTHDNDKAMMAAVALGPVSVAIEADQPAFQFYKSGVFSDSSCGTMLDHGVLAVGYDTLNNQGYWIVKNSWGDSWGNKGYIWMARKDGDGECGINMESSYPTVKA